MRELRRKTLLPVFKLTRVCDAHDLYAAKCVIVARKSREPLTYHLRPLVDMEGEPKFNYNLFPVVLDRDAAPWDLGTLYIFSRLEAEILPNIATYHSIADDLGAFKEWLDDHDNPVDMLFHFPQTKLRRATYRYNGFLKKQIQAREIAPGTAKRRMGTVISFYRWMQEECLFEPDFDPWQERSFQLSLKTRYGGCFSKWVTSTDIGIKAPKTDDPFAGTIQDGGKLRPLTDLEQRWVMEAADQLGNPEMYILILFMILTGARIQTATTLRLRHVTLSKVVYSKPLGGNGQVYKLKIGPGTSIDTKNNKNMVLQVPRPLFETLCAYAFSTRSTNRRKRAVGGDSPNQYLFLTQQGNPYYQAHDETLVFNPKLAVRHNKNGGTIRKFFADSLIPYIRERHDPNFFMRPHDLRATFGMNQTDMQLVLVQQGIITLSQARNNVRALMGHESAATTDLYLDYRKQMELVYAALNNYGEQVQNWIDSALRGFQDG
jgi:integrase